LSNQNASRVIADAQEAWQHSGYVRHNRNKRVCDAQWKRIAREIIRIGCTR